MKQSVFIPAKQQQAYLLVVCKPCGFLYAFDSLRASFRVCLFPELISLMYSQALKNTQYMEIPLIALLHRYFRKLSM